MATKTYSNVRRNGRSASWVRVLKALNMSDTPLAQEFQFLLSLQDYPS